MNFAPDRLPSPTTLAAAAAEQAADAMPRETALQDGVLLVLSYEGDNIFVLSSSSYEHVLDSAFANFSRLRKVERAHLRLALQTTIGTSATLVYITPDTWPAVASRAKVITVLVQRPPSPPQSSPRPRLSPVTHRVASPVREPEPSSWPGSPHPGTSWHPAYPPSAAYPPPGASPARSTTRPLVHSRPHSSGASASASAPHYPYAHMHYFPAPPSAVSPTTDLSFIGVRPLTEAELKQERPAHHAVPAKRHWEQVDDAASDERVSYAHPPPETPGGLQAESARSLGGPSQPDESRKPKRARAWNPPDHQYSCKRCQRTDSPAWRKGPDGPKTLCNACGLSYAKEIARREAASAAPQQALGPQEQSAGYGHSSGAAAPRSARGTKTFDGSQVAEGSSPSTSAPAAPRACSVCGRTDSPQWRKGPNGPNTLCNSCGLAWARTQRKPEGTLSRPGSSRSPSPTVVPPTYHQAAPLPRSPNGQTRSPSAGSHPASPTPGAP